MAILRVLFFRFFADYYPLYDVYSPSTGSGLSHSPGVAGILGGMDEMKRHNVTWRKRAGRYISEFFISLCIFGPLVLYISPQTDSGLSHSPGMAGSLSEMDETRWRNITRRKQGGDISYPGLQITCASLFRGHGL